MHIQAEAGQTWSTKYKVQKVAAPTLLQAVTVESRDYLATPLPYARNVVVFCPPANVQSPDVAETTPAISPEQVDVASFSFSEQLSTSPRSEPISESFYMDTVPLETTDIDRVVEYSVSLDPLHDFPTDLLPPDELWPVENHWNGDSTDLSLSHHLTTDDDIWRDLEKFFDAGYVIFPVISYQDLASRLILQPAWGDDPALSSLLLSIRLISMAGDYRMFPSNDNRTQLLALISQVEISRLGYDFADPATLDAVVVSLFLFTAYNVLGKYNRSFLYLDEAFSLFDGADVRPDEARRRQQIRLVLFNTEAATVPIYAPSRKKYRSHQASVRDNEGKDCCLSVETEVQSERVALHLLRRLTEINLAENAEALKKLDVESETDMVTLFGAIFRQHRPPMIQAADVAITRQWHLSFRLISGPRQVPGAPTPLRVLAEQLGTVALSWICLLGEGELRVVGLGKLAALARHIRSLAGSTQCHTVLGGLIGAIIREDHERLYAPQLADVVMPMASFLPSTLTSPRPRTSSAAIRRNIFAAAHQAPMVSEDESMDFFEIRQPSSARGIEVRED